MNLLRPSAFCALLLLGCSPDNPAPPASAPTTAPAPPPAPAPATYIHPGTKMPFPETVARFHRIEITKFSPDESDIGVGYASNDPALPVTITVYIFPAPPLAPLPSDTPGGGAAQARQFAQALAAVTSEIARVHPDAQTLSQK